ncbi:DUF397 domain-containing protein [Goodfellowiella coeruleoviolacea]|uniref:DUF397 domain-containing protein n=1 Tax=Goodfellowiella coeruleoviolacea TaxID=334858 RepID=A0AAE3GC98_9PSEU|nr:DUF397 domain-containing protein [Goodfellowiella coeruleoviolacea]MCP2165475.1 protein of unknown function (DUF397) [Goodfellowiella coeruleoviolacea]
MTPTSPAGLWRTSSHSTGTGNCVQLAFTADAVAVRDSKNPAGPVLTFARAGLARFLTVLKRDRLTR